MGLTWNGIAGIIATIGLFGLGIIFNHFKFRGLGKQLGDLAKNLKNTNTKLGVVCNRTESFVISTTHSFPDLRAEILFAGTYQVTAQNYEANYPVSLNEKGNDVAVKLDARATVKKLLPKVIDKMPEQPLLMQVQQTCFDYAFNELIDDVDEGQRRRIDRHIYEEGGESKNTLMVYGIMLRDAIFKKLGLE